MEKRAAVYCRVSTEGQAKTGYSLEKQQEVLPEDARRRGFELRDEDIFVEVMSGAKDDRPEYNRLLAQVIEGIYQAVFVIEPSRLTRTESRAEEDRIIETFKAFGCLIMTPYSTFDFSSLEGIINWDYNSLASRHERMRSRMRTVTGRRTKLLKGGYIGGYVPTGYVQRRHEDTGKVYFEIDEIKMTPVRIAFDMALQGGSLMQITRRLYSEGFRTKNDTIISASTIAWWLKNSSYAGFTHQGYGRSKNIKDKVLVEENNFLEPIISKEDWQAVQDQLKQRSRFKGRRRRPLSGILLCPSCETPMTSNTYHSGRYYKCLANKIKRVCPERAPKSIKQDLAHELVLELIPKLVKYIDRHFDESHVRLAQRQSINPESRLESLTKHKASLHKRIMANIKEQELAPSDLRRERIIELESEYNQVMEEIKIEGKKGELPTIPRLKGLDEVAHRIKPTDIDTLVDLFPLLFKNIRFKRYGGNGSYSYRITSFVTTWDEWFTVTPFGCLKLRR